MSPEMAETELACSYRGPRLDRRHRRETDTSFLPNPNTNGLPYKKHSGKLLYSLISIGIVLSPFESHPMTLSLIGEDCLQLSNCLTRYRARDSKEQILNPRSRFFRGWAPSSSSSCYS